ncbi:MAG: CcmD family protein [Thermoplasmatota archaeon]
MPADATTFFVAFTAVFAGLGLYLWRLNTVAARLERRIDALEAASAAATPSIGGTGHNRQDEA